jgi:putative nucleotidyltransferase with HDIG domain
MPDVPDLNQVARQLLYRDPVDLKVDKRITTRSSPSTRLDPALHLAQLNVLVSTVHTLSTAINARDEVTPRHVLRVQHGALALARELGVTDEDTLCGLEAAALLHDTGKMAVPEHILNKPGRLTPREFETMKRHAPIGAQLLAAIAFPYPVAPVVRHHHENWDGTGYPDGLKGEDIPLGARILSVVDCYDALTSDRPYRPRMTEMQALQIIQARRGIQYDPAVVDAFMQCHDRIMPPGDTPDAPAAKPEEADEQDQHGLDIGGEGVCDALLALASLSRALDGDAKLSDVGGLLWILLRQIVPSDAMAIFLPDEMHDHVVIRYAAGLHAADMLGVTRPTATGIAGWSAVNRRAVLNAEPVLDLGFRAESAPVLRSCVVTPLVDSDALVAVLALYSKTGAAFSEDHLRLLEVLGPRLASALLDAAIADEESQLIAAARPRSLKLVQSS